MNGPNVIKVLSIEDNLAEAILIQERLARATQLGWDLPRFEITHVRCMRDALALLDDDTPIDVILTDLDLPDSRSEATFITLRDHDPTLPIVVLTSREDVELARKTVRAGADDYLFKQELSGSLLAHTLIYAIERQQIHNTLEQRVEARTAALEESKQALQREKEKAERYLNIAPSIIIALDTQGRITLLNEMGADILECEQDAALGKNWFETFLPARIRKDVQATFAQLISGNVPLFEDVENVILTAQGNERSIRWHNTVLRDEAGEITGLLSSGEDITQRKEVEGALKESEERFRLAVSHSGIIFAQTDRDLRYTWVYNPHPDFSPDVVVGKRDDELMDNAGTRQLMQLKQEVLDTGENLRKDIAFPLSNGQRVYDILAEPLRDDDGDVIGVATCAQDITERKVAEDALRESERRYRELLNSMSDGIVVLDTEFNVVEANRALRQDTGTDREVLGEKCFAAFYDFASPCLFKGW